MKILTANNQEIVQVNHGYRAWIENMLMRRWQSRANWDLCDAPVYAWINQSNWAADCECGGSLVVEPGEPYICPDCGNVEHGCKARPVIWPDNKDDIERVLLMRPYPKNRNWLPGETLEDLQAENRKHKLEV